MAQVRAKFFVTTLEPWYGSKGGMVKLRPVYSQDPNHENKSFWDATPNGDISLSINNPAAFSFFMEHALGYEFYVDFMPVLKEDQKK